MPVVSDEVIQVAKHVSDEGKQPNDRSSMDQMSVWLGGTKSLTRIISAFLSFFCFLFLF